jgi:GntR family transcriptional regulator
VLKRDVVPLYHQLKELLTEKIESGEWEPGYRLPGELEISKEFGLSRATVRQAMGLLENQGLVERFRGRGTFVGRPKLANNLMMLFSPMRGMTGTESVPALEVDYLRTVGAPASLALRLGIKADEMVYELKRRVVVDKEPLLLIPNWLPVGRFPGLETEFDKHGTVMRAVARYGIDRVHQHKEVEITILDDTEAAALDTRPGSPALLVTYLTSEPTGEPFEYRKLVVRGDRCRYYIDQDNAEFFV